MIFRFGVIALAVGASMARAASAAVDTSTPIAAVHSLFAAMANHDAQAGGSLFLPGAQIISIGKDQVAHSTASATFLDHLGKSKDQWLERIWDPKVLEDKTVAVVWAPFDFHLNGKFSHCGIDSFSLVKSGEGWKFASISYSQETTTCKPSPLGPPASGQ